MLRLQTLIFAEYSSLPTMLLTYIPIVILLSSVSNFQEMPIFFAVKEVRFWNTKNDELYFHLDLLNLPSFDSSYICFVEITVHFFVNEA